MLTRLLRYLCAGSPRNTQSAAVRTRRHSFVPRLEELESRDTPSTLNVTNLLDTGFAGDGSLRGELAAAHPGDTIIFQPGLHGPILLGSDLKLTQNVNIQGSLDALGNPLVTLDGQHLMQDVHVNAGVTASLVGLGIANGFYYAGDTSQGGGIENLGSLTLQNCSITGNWAGSSQVISPGGAGFIVGEGGGIYNAGALTVQNSTLSGNVAGGFGVGGAIYNDAGQWVQHLPLPPQWKTATASITGCTIIGNSAYDGGGIAEETAGGNLTIKNTTITGNTAAHDAGGVYIAANRYGVALSANVNALATTLAVGKAAYFTVGETIRIDNEQMVVTSVDTVHNTLTVTRGANHTAAVAHLGGANVLGIVTTIDAFTLTHLINNIAPSNANIDGLYFTSP